MIDVPASVLEDRVTDFLTQHPPAATADRDLRAARFDAGLAFPHFDPGAGGIGADPGASPYVERAMLAAGAEDWSQRNVIGLGMAAPVLHTYGTASQRGLLRSLFVGDDIWCQLFSEPGAGSDLAGLATRAVADGDGWRVTGEKVWTTLGHVASFGLLLARTDPEQPKHRGLTFFVLDMSLPGVEVSPLRQMTGDAEFNSVRLDGVHVPADAVLGAVGDGWRVAMTTLMNERSSLGSSGPDGGRRPIQRAIELSQRPGCDLGSRSDRLMGLWVNAEVATMHARRAAASRGAPGPDGSIMKLAMARSNKAVYELCVDLLGADGTGVDDYAAGRPTAASVHGTGDIRKAFLRTRANSIEGGTSEVLRNVLAERVLGLPPEPRTDRDMPWSKVRRG